LKDGREVDAVTLVGRLFHARATVTRNDRSTMVLYIKPHVTTRLSRPIRDAATTSRRFYASSTGCPSESVLCSKWHAWRPSRCPGGRLSTWQMIAASCLTVLGALYGQLTSRLALYHEHTASVETEILQPLVLVCGTLQLRNPDITYGLFRRQLKSHIFGISGHSAS